MSETIEGETVELPKLTVGQFLKDMAQYPQESPLFAMMSGIGMTIAIKSAAKVNTKEIGDMVVLEIDQAGVIAALTHNMQHNEVMKQAKIDDGFKN